MCGQGSRRNNKNDRSSKYMKMNHLSMISAAARKSRRANLNLLALGALCVIGFVETSRAQGTLSATATVTETGTSGSEYDYTLTLDNTGGNAINAFWYGWTQGSFNLPGAPTSLAGPTGWTASADGNSVQFGNSTGTAIPAGETGTFTFQSTFDPAAMTSGTHDGDPTGDSVAYATVAAMDSFDESDPGVASGPFVPTLNPVPEPGTFGLLATGLSGMSFWLARRRAGK
jgi:hypothetical protein